MLIAATTNCFRNLPLDQGLEKIADLEFSYIELMFHETNSYLKPSVVADDLQGTLLRLKQLHRLIPVVFSVEITTEDKAEYLRQFTAICKLAKAMQVVTIALHSAPKGTPFNEEVERLRLCVEAADQRGIIVGLVTERDRLTEDLETAKMFCSVVPGLGLTLDPSHYIYKYVENKVNFESIFDLVVHVRLRDSRSDKFQVCVGQGTVEFGRLITHLAQHHYNQTLSVDIIPDDEVDVPQEMRKMRLLLESLL